MLTGYLAPMMSSSLAYEVGFGDIGKLLRDYEGFHSIFLGMSNEERYARNFFNLGSHDKVILVDIIGEKNSNVKYSRCYLWNKDQYDNEEIRSKCHPSRIMGDYAWYVECVPQILARQLWFATFREGKSITELDYTIGISMNEYSSLGLA